MITGMLLTASAMVSFVCVGYEQVTYAKPGERKPYRRTFHIDFDAQRWCQDSCEQTWNLSGLNEDQIWLTRFYITDGGGSTTDTIDRKSGIERYIHEALLEKVERIAHCTKAPTRVRGKRRR